MLATVQAIAARVGVVSKRGLEDDIRASYGRGWALVVLIAIIAVNVLTLAADIGGGAAALALLAHIDYRWFVVPFAAGVVLLLVFGRYESIARVLKLLSLIFLAYVVAAFFARPDWGAVLRGTLIPHYEFTQAYVAGAIALLGTTLTAYAYVWETVELAEERPPLRQLGLVQADAVLGTIFAGIIFWFIVVTTGATLGVHHKEVQTAQDAAQALVPLAGPYAAALFAVGLLASALLAVPVIAGTCAYVVAETFGWRRSLDATFARAPRFYAALVLSVGAATAIALAGIPPITLLFASSIAGGLATPLTLVFLILVAGRADVMGKHRVGGPLRAAGWAVTAVVAASALAYLVSLI
jgi:Mn2+/Fe2+ NRAMP family transporter